MAEVVARKWWQPMKKEGKDSLLNKKGSVKVNVGHL